jgi:DNA invertase Pin-like site-specific DNA recombinase
VVVWALDRLSREGVAETVEHTKRLKSHGVEFISHQEAHFRTIGPAGELMIAVAAWIAERERRRRPKGPPQRLRNCKQGQAQLPGPEASGGRAQAGAGKATL